MNRLFRPNVRNLKRLYFLRTFDSNRPIRRGRLMEAGMRKTRLRLAASHATREFLDKTQSPTPVPAQPRHIVKVGLAVTEGGHLLLVRKKGTLSYILPGVITHPQHPVTLRLAVAPTLRERRGLRRGRCGRRGVRWRRWSRGRHRPWRPIANGIRWSLCGRSPRAAARARFHC